MEASHPDDANHGHLLSPLALAVTATAEHPRPYVSAAHLNLLSNELVKLRMRPPGWPRNLLVTMPPRHGKSETCSHWFPVWDVALEPHDKILFASYEAEFAAKWGRAARRTLEEHYPILGARVLDDSRAGHRWETKEGGGMVTAGVGGPLMGRGGDILICDDPIKNAEEANSPLVRQHVWDWWQSTFLTRREPDAIVILIMTRWHEDDLAGRILTSGEKKAWRHIDLPAIAEEDDPLGRMPGEALWPERYDELALENIRAEVGGRVWSALYQQHPAPPEGLGIQRGWWQWYTELPPLEKFDEILQSWDPTFKAVDTADYVCGGVLGRLGGTIYVIDVVRKRMNGPDTLKAIAAMDEAYPMARRLLMEDTASGSMMCDILQRDRRGGVERITPRGSKETRLHWGVNATAAVAERGQIYLRKGAEWAQILVDEAANFPNAPHDDTVDMLVQGVNKLLPRTWSWENQQQRALAGAPLPTTPLQLHQHNMREFLKKRMKDLETGRRPRANRERGSDTWGWA